MVNCAPENIQLPVIIPDLRSWSEYLNSSWPKDSHIQRPWICDDIPLLVGIPCGACPYLKHIAVREGTVGEIDAFVRPDPLDGTVRQGVPLLVSVALDTSPDL